MKTNQTDYSDPELERHLIQRDKEHKKSARKLGKHFARKNLPCPAGDTLNPYIGQIKSAYEADAAYIIKHHQPKTLVTELRLDTEYARDRDKTLEGTVNAKQSLNQNDLYDLEDFNPTNIRSRICWVIILTLCLLTGETAWNTVSFQVTGLTLLFSMFLSFVFSVAVFIVAHLIPMYYKHLLTKLKRRVLLVVSTVLITGAFYVVAVFRSMYLARYGVTLSLGYFIIINLFFYATSAMLSYFLFPPLDEIMDHWHHNRQLKNIKKRSKEIEEHEEERQELRNVVYKNAIMKIGIATSAKDLLELTRRRYAEAIEIFKSTNLIYRSDKLTPDCFHYGTPPPDIDDPQIPVIK
jgi:hypothetical protein